MNWKRLAAVSAALALCLAGCAQEKPQATGMGDDLLAAIRARGEITVALEGTWAPWGYHDEAGELVKPQSPNGYKFENLILDMIHQMGSCLPFEVVREKEFAPIKNKTGIDSVESARELLQQNGVVL